MSKTNMILSAYKNECGNIKKRCYLLGNGFIIYFRKCKQKN